MSHDKGKKPKGKKPNGKFDSTTHLYIRTNPADIGIRPISSELPVWISPDITIIRPGGIRGSEGAVGEANQVEVVVNNSGGIDAVDAYVEVFLVDPSTVCTPAIATPVGNGFLTIPNHNLATITFPWTPAVTDAGHRCMFARVCLTVPYDCYANPSIFDVQNDRHVAQRNLNVVKIETETLSFRFLVVNPLQKKGTFILQTTEVHVGRNADHVRRALGSNFAQFGQAKLGGIGLSLDKPVPPVQKHRAATKYSTGVLRERLAVPKAKSVHLEMGRDEQRYAVLTIACNPDIRKGDLNVVQVQQIDARTERTVGGLWLIVQH